MVWIEKKTTKGLQTEVKPFYRLSALSPVADDTREVQQAATVIHPLSVRVFQIQAVILIETSST